MINIIHILEDFSFLSGGLRTTVKNLHDRLIENNIKSTIITTRKEKEDDVVLVKGGSTPWRFSINLITKLNELKAQGKIDIIHIHGVWMYPQYAAAKFSTTNNIPFLISCHGMYEPWLWLKGGIKKKTYFKYVVKDVFSKANYIHAITEPEAKELKRLFFKTKIKVIPNLIDPKQSVAKKSCFKEKYILYLGRIDEKKGIDLLIRAFGTIQEKGFRLKIAGNDNNYKDVLDKLVKQLNLQTKVDFLGLVIGEEKELLFKNAFVFIAPSHSEVIGMVNLESAILGTPVITTFQTGLKKEWADNGGILINPTVQETKNALEMATNWSNDERNKRGNLLSEFVKKEYSWEFKLKDWIHLYKKLV
jgi:glycosyltransferase involved in cell wall biosynthesis